MWPTLLDMTKEESIENLRCLELNAYAGLITAFRAQGVLNSEKLKLLKETGSALNISQDRHKAEVRRAVNDEKLNTIAYHVSGHKSTTENWSQEGRRLIPLMPRVAPQTVYSAIADEAADSASKSNKLLPHPASTERKRSAPISPTPAVPTESNKATPLRTPDAVKVEETAKKKKVTNSDGDRYSQVMGPPKAANKVQQLYRRAKMKQKDNLHVMKIRSQQHQPPPPPPPQQQQDCERSVEPPSAPSTLPPTVNLSSPVIKPPPPTTAPLTITPSPLPPTPKPPPEQCTPVPIHSHPQPKINVLQNITILPINATTNNTDENNLSTNQQTAPSCDNLTIKPIPAPKTIKVCPPRKLQVPTSAPSSTVPKTTVVTTNTGQKLVVVSTPQTSILQRTLTIPFVKNISVKNYNDKFKIVPSGSSSAVSMQLVSASTTTTTVVPTTITTSTSFMNNFKGKHKVVTVRTNGSGGGSVNVLSGSIISKQVAQAQPGQRIIPMSQFQMLSAKGGIKVLPFGSKIIQKSPQSPPVFITTTTVKSDGDGLVVNEHKTEVSLVEDSLPPPSAVVVNSLMDFESQITQHTIQTSGESSVDSLVSEAGSSVGSGTTQGGVTDEDHMVVVEEEEGMMGGVVGEEESSGDYVSNHVGEVEEEEEEEEEEYKDDVTIGVTVKARDEQAFYMIENEDDDTIETDMSVDQSTELIENSLTGDLQYTVLDKNDIQLQEELVTIESQHVLESGIVTNDLELDLNTYN